ncbi:MAG: HDOD domain-containing protein [Magnetococcales bacterium]|nr:HDOD domain-containing protein [Magnetococcales bacterium]
MVNDKQEEMLLKEIGIPSQPKVVLDIYKEVNSPNPSVKKIADLVVTDQALSAKIIKVINSPFYGKPMPIRSIQHALTMLGLRNFYKVVLVASLREALAGGGKADPMMESNWKHAVAVAKTAEFLAVWMKSTVSPEEAYMVGLFHDSAMPMMIKKLHGYKEFLKDPTVFNENQVELEVARFSASHAVLGAMLAKSWGISQHIHQAIRYHHTSDYDDIPVMEEPRLWLILRLADYIAEYAAWRNGQDTLEHQQFKNSEDAGFTNDVMGLFGYSVDSVRDMQEDALDLLDWSDG